MDGRSEQHDRNRRKGGDHGSAMPEWDAPTDMSVPFEFKGFEDDDRKLVESKAAAAAARSTAEELQELQGVQRSMPADPHQHQAVKTEDDFFAALENPTAPGGAHIASPGLRWAPSLRLLLCLRTQYVVHDFECF